MFEPDVDNLALLRATVKRAKLRGVFLRPVAASDRTGQREFIRDPISGATGGIASTATNVDQRMFSERQWNVSGEKTMVDAITLDEERRLGGPVDLIKIDVEGHEEAVIAGAIKTIESDQPTIIFECFHGGAEISKCLVALGYVILDVSCSEPSPRTDNFLALPRRQQNALPTLRGCCQGRDEGEKT